MRRHILTAAAGLAANVAFTTTSHAQHIVGVRDARALRADSVFQRFDRTDSPGCALGVYQDGKVLYSRGYGMASLEHGVALSPRSVLDVGCGIGRNLHHLDGNGVGVDLNPHSVQVARQQGLTAYTTDEFDISPAGGPFSTAFVEYRPNPRWAITLDVDNLLNSKGYRDRLIFIPDRAQSDLAIREFRERNRHLNFGLTVKRSFGSGAELLSNVAAVCPAIRERSRRVIRPPSKRPIREHRRPMRTCAPRATLGSPRAAGRAARGRRGSAGTACRRVRAARRSSRPRGVRGRRSPACSGAGASHRSGGRGPRLPGRRLQRTRGAASTGGAGN